MLIINHGSKVWVGGSCCIPPLLLTISLQQSLLVFGETIQDVSRNSCISESFQLAMLTRPKSKPNLPTQQIDLWESSNMQFQHLSTPDLLFAVGAVENACAPTNGECTINSWFYFCQCYLFCFNIALAQFKYFDCSWLHSYHTEAGERGGIPPPSQKFPSLAKVPFSSSPPLPPLLLADETSHLLVDVFL